MQIHLFSNEFFFFLSVEIDLCEISPINDCGSDEVYVKKPGTYECHCKKGYARIGTNCVGTLFLFLCNAFKDRLFIDQFYAAAILRNRV